MSTFEGSERGKRADGSAGRLAAAAKAIMAAFVVLAIGLSVIGVADGGSQAWAQTEGRDVAPPEPKQGHVPGDSLGNTSDAQFWREIRRGMQGSVSLPNKQAGVLIQSEGDNWRAVRNGPLSLYGSWALLGIVILLALFFAIRGRVRIEAGPSGRTIERFNGLERFTHWLTASCFVVLALTGLNLLYGRYVLLPVIGPEAFAGLTTAGKYAHNFLAFPFMLGLVLMFVLWVRHNIPNKYDLIWISKAGGLFTTGSHPPSKKFNAGQKIIFWLVILTGITLSSSGIQLLFPFELALWGKTFEALNALGAGLPTNVTPMMEQQLSQVWHAAIGLFAIVVIVAHIYIGSIGMEGAFAAMGSGEVDLNWAREHHNIWVAEKLGEKVDDQHHQPAE
ncbi:MAG: formate dehydrogenase subunit gamma [Rhodovibrionaceae bacterium]|nr:formate dehydrogenase subunit gamma [Rhodovibrionaceae bacterium]